MTWKKYFSPVPVNHSAGSLSPIGGASSKPGPARSNYSSLLPEVYTGAPNRIERYLQYSTMDMDPEVSSALNILAEFCTQTNKSNNTAFSIYFKNQATNSEVSILKEYLQQWCKLQQFETRIFRIARNTFKNGDCFFIRDPENQKWNYIDPAKIVKIIVNESEGKIPEQYVIKDLSPNFAHLVVTAINPNTTATSNRGTSYVAGGAAARGMVGAYPANPSSTGSRFQTGEDEVAIDAKHVVHISLSEGLDNNYPFGNSLLETVFKTYKQKELLEDAILIYRIQRAPERRIFYIDVGNMPAHLAMTFVERVKNEIQQRRIPSATGGGNVIDSAFNPMSQMEDFFLPVSADSRGSKVDTLPGGNNIGEITDLTYFTNKLFRALQIPSSYLPTGADDGQQQYKDGRVGTAMIQEFRFNTYCIRLQNLMKGIFDQEFKLYLFKKGVNIDSSLFDLEFNPPQNFAAHRQMELDDRRTAHFMTMVAVPFISNRFAMKRYLGWSEEEIAENERMWAEENGESESITTDSSGEMRGVGISQSGMQTDMTGLQDASMPMDGEPGAEPGMTNGGGDIQQGADANPQG